MREVPIKDLIKVFQPGSGDEEWSWSEELKALSRTLWFHELVDDIREKGVKEPVLLGADGRVWDGHHRILAGWYAGKSIIPVVFSGE